MVNRPRPEYTTSGASMKKRHGTTSWKRCQTCGASYPRSAKWCLVCRDNYGRLRADWLDKFYTTAEPIAPAPLAIRPRQKPLAVLAQRIAEAGYIANVRAIARGETLGKFPRPLAIEVVHELDGWHDEQRICTSCTYTVQQAAEAALRIIFHQGVPA